MKKLLSLFLISSLGALGDTSRSITYDTVTKQVAPSGLVFSNIFVGSPTVSTNPINKGYFDTNLGARLVTATNTTQLADTNIFPAALRKAGVTVQLASGGVYKLQPDGTNWYGVLFNPRDFGARGDGVTDDTSAFTNCIATAALTQAAVSVSVGTYLIDHLDVTGISDFGGANSVETESTILLQKSGSTNNFLTLSSATPAPIVHDIVLRGQREKNLRASNKRTIVTASTNRLSFTLDSPAPVDGAGTQVFFYSPLDNGSYRYLGAAYASSISGTNVTLLAGYDTYCGPAPDGVLLPGYIMCLPSNATEGSLTILDPSLAGNSGVDFNQTRGNEWQFRNVHVQFFHTGIRRGYAIALGAFDVVIQGCSYAGIGMMSPIGSDDNLDMVHVAGQYQRDRGSPVESGSYTYHPEYRQTYNGLRLQGVAIRGGYLQVYNCVNNISADYAINLSIAQITADGSVRDSILVGNKTVAYIGSVVIQGVGPADSGVWSGVANNASTLSIHSLIVGGGNAGTAAYAVNNANGGVTTVFGDVGGPGYNQFDYPFGSTRVFAHGNSWENNGVNLSMFTGPNGTAFGHEDGDRFQITVNNRDSGIYSGVVTVSQSGTALTASGPFFTTNMVGRLLVFGATNAPVAGYSLIKTYTDSTHAVSWESKTNSADIVCAIAGTPVADLYYSDSGYAPDISIKTTGSFKTGKTWDCRADIDCGVPSVDLSNDTYRLWYYSVPDYKQLGQPLAQTVCAFFAPSVDQPSVVQYGQITGKFPLKATYTAAGTNASIVAGTLTCTNAAFVAGDVGKFIAMRTSLTYTPPLTSEIIGTITSVISTNQCTLDTGGLTVSSLKLFYLDSKMLKVSQ